MRRAFPACALSAVAAALIGLAAISVSSPAGACLRSGASLFAPTSPWPAPEHMDWFLGRVAVGRLPDALTREWRVSDPSPEATYEPWEIDLRCGDRQNLLKEFNVIHLVREDVVRSGPVAGTSGPVSALISAGYIDALPDHAPADTGDARVAMPIYVFSREALSDDSVCMVILARAVSERRGVAFMMVAPEDQALKAWSEMGCAVVLVRAGD